MSWVFLDGIKFSGASTLSMTFDGAAVWVSRANNTISVCSYIGESAGEEDIIDMDGVLTDTVYMLKVYDKMYAFDSNVGNFVKIDIPSRTVEGNPVVVQRTTNCVPAYGNGKLWFVSDEDDTKQYLFYYDLSDNTWSTYFQIPGRYQTSPRKIIWGRDAYIYVTNANESGLTKFNANTGAYITQILTNRQPAGSSHLTTNDNFEILVSGFNGMVSSVNQTTDTPSNIAGLPQTTDNFVDDGTYLWTIEPTLTRITKSTSVDNLLMMKEVPNVTGEQHINVYDGFGFALNNPNVTSISLVQQEAGYLVEGEDYTFEVDQTFAEQRMTILRDAPRITGDEPYTIVVNYSYQPELKDYEITGFTDTTFKQVLTTPEYTHEYWDTETLTVKTRTEEQRVVLLANNALYFAYNLTDSWTLPDIRGYELTIKATALVGTGEYAYHGETT